MMNTCDDHIGVSDKDVQQQCRTCHWRCLRYGGNCEPNDTLRTCQLVREKPERRVTIPIIPDSKGGDLEGIQYRFHDAE